MSAFSASFASPRQAFPSSLSVTATAAQPMRLQAHRLTTATLTGRHPLSPAATSSLAARALACSGRCLHRRLCQPPRRAAAQPSRPAKRPLATLSAAPTDCTPQRRSYTDCNPQRRSYRPQPSAPLPQTIDASLEITRCQSEHHGCTKNSDRVFATVHDLACCPQVRPPLPQRGSCQSKRSR